MIGKRRLTEQFLFYLMPDETAQVVECILSQGCAIFLDRSSSGVPCEYKSPSCLTRGFFCPADLAKDVVMHRVSEAHYFLAPDISPVVEMDCSFLRAKELSLGRLYYRAGYMSADGWVSFPESVDEAFKKTKGFMKRCLLTKDREFGGYISKGCIKYVSEGGHLSQF